MYLPRYSNNHKTSTASPAPCEEAPPALHFRYSVHTNVHTISCFKVIDNGIIYINDISVCRDIGYADGDNQFESFRVRHFLSCDVHNALKPVFLDGLFCSDSIIKAALGSLKYFY